MTCARLELEVNDMMENEQEFGIVYVLTNPAMPGLVKIGKTSRRAVDARLNELYSTGVPVPFECAFAGMVIDEARIERAFHQAFGPYRINPKREFFEIEADQAIALLELLVVEDVTPELQDHAEKVDEGSRDGTRKLKARRPPLNYLDMGMEIGSIIEFTEGEHTATVKSGRRIDYRGEDISLTALTQKLLKIDRPIQPTPYWTYKGRNLTDIYEDTYDLP